MVSVLSAFSVFVWWVVWLVVSEATHLTLCHKGAVCTEILGLTAQRAEKWRARKAMAVDLLISEACW